MNTRFPIYVLFNLIQIKRLVSKGVKLIKKKLDTLESFINEYDYDVVFNCLGLSNISFCNDKNMVPIRGQMIRVNAPWIKHFYYTDDNCYIIPKYLQNYTKQILLAFLLNI